MIQNYLFDLNEFIYLRLQSLIWAKDGLKSRSTLQLSGVNLLEKIYKEICTDKFIVINCIRVQDISERSLDNFFHGTFQEINRRIIFVNKDKIHNSLTAILDRLGINRIVEKNYICVCNKNTTVENIDEIYNTIESYESDFVKRIIKDCYKGFDSSEKRLYSTPVLASGEFDATKIISNPCSFQWISQILADKLDIFKDEIAERKEEYSDLKLIAVSLRASPFVSAIALLTNMNYYLIDHLGPKHKLFDLDVIDRIEKGSMYIYIGDFLIGGTEVKIAQTYANLCGCKLKYALVLGSYLESDAFTSDFELKYLTLLNDPKVTPNVKFTLK